MEVSDCCGASIYPETDVCSDCKEHCTPVEEDEEELFEDSSYADQRTDEYRDEQRGI